jgi:hypothetical protein
MKSGVNQRRFFSFDINQARVNGAAKALSLAKCERPRLNVAAGSIMVKSLPNIALPQPDMNSSSRHRGAPD